MSMSANELERTYRRTYRRLIIGISMVYGVALLAGLAALVGNPKLAGWVSETLQAEFVSPDVRSVTEPIRLVPPPRRIRTVKAD